jgi:hypothetical protein
MVEVHMNHTRTRAIGENAAGRLFRIFQVCESFKSSKDTESTIKMWHQAFGLKDASKNALGYLVLDVCTEIDLLHEQAKKAGLPDDLLTDTFTRLKSVADVTALERTANQPTQHLLPADVISLRWMSLYLPDVTRSDLSAQAKDRLKKAIDELRSAAAAPGVAPAYGEYARNLADRLEKALNESCVKGSSVVEKIVWETIVQTGTIPPNEGAPEVVEANGKVASKVIDAFKTVGDIASNGDKILTFVEKAATKGSAALNFVVNMLN